MSDIKVTLKRKVWAAVRNKPGIYARDIYNLLKTESRSSISSALSVLEANEVIYSTGMGGRHDPRQYFTKMEIYDADKASHYAYRNNIMRGILPPPKNPFKPKEDIVNTNAPAVTTRKLDIDFIFDNLTFNECRELYKKLDEVFGN